jgi:hypothetical protein
MCLDWITHGLGMQWIEQLIDDKLTLCLRKDISWIIGNLMSELTPSTPGSKSTLASINPQRIWPL